MSSKAKITGPLFKWFGSKWLSSRLLPVPEYDVLYEPFAGGAGYSLRHCEKRVVLAEIDPHVFLLWEWLIKDATERLIREIPLNVPEGTDIRSLGLSIGQATLVKSWQRTNNVGDCWTVSPWGNKPGQWTASTRSRVAEEHEAIRHWKCETRDGFELLAAHKDERASWLIDPPYKHNYQYRRAPIDYRPLTSFCRNAKGQIIVCEAVCQKTAAVPDWLPFTFFGERITSRRKVGNNHHSKELIWTSSDDR